MANRRRILFGIGGALLAAWALLSWAPSRRRRIVDERHDNTGTVTPDLQDADQLLQDLSRLAARDYSEEGIAVFLACENLAAAKDKKTEPAFVPSALNEQLAGEFNRYVRLLPQLRPEVTEADLATLVELLADRNLVAASREFAP